MPYRASACGLQRALSLGSYETAWTWLHKLRTAMASYQLSGHVEVCEMVLGNRSDPASRISVLIAVGKEESERPRLRVRLIPEHSASSLLTFITKVVAPKSAVYIDGGDAQLKLEMKKYGIKMTSKSVNEMAEAYSELATEPLLQGRHANDQLDILLDELAFRFKTTWEDHGELFYRLVRQATAATPLPYSALIAHNRARKLGEHND